MIGFDKEFFVGNRQRLAEALPSSYILIAANSMMQKSADTTYEFRQDSSFWYLTGLDEPDLVLGINTKTGQSTLFTKEQNDYQKQWDGTLSKKEIQKQSGTTQTLSRINLDSEFRRARGAGLELCYLKPLDEVVEPYGFYSNPARRKLESEICEALECGPEDIKDVRLEVARLRQIKQPIELEAIQKAINITGETLADVKGRMMGLKNEKELERAITSEFYTRGADGHGYQPIVASGKNAAVIHYISNCKKLAISDLVLLDVGAAIGYYSADISRTWFIANSTSNEPSKRQQEVYQAVLDLQKKAFSLLGPGVKLKEYQKTMENHAFAAMKKLGVKMGKYPHGFSHFLGLDVHDAGDYDAPLTENSVLTVEPGIYLSEEKIGVRIEDIVRITKDGIKIMSKGISRSL